MSPSLAKIRSDPYAGRLALLGETTITDPVTNITTTPITDLEGLQSLIAQCVFAYGSGGETADFYLQTSFDNGTTWTDVAAFRFPGVTGRLATDFDGSSDYYSKGSGLTGAADGKVGTVSFWVKFEGGDGDTQDLFSGSRFVVSKITTNVFRVQGSTSAPATTLDLRSVATYTASAAWIHVLSSWNLATSAEHLYVDDASDLSVITTDNNNIDYTTSAWGFGASPTGLRKSNAVISEFYFALEYIDLSVEANRRKFISAAGHPVPLGADGSTPTGTQPIVYSIDGDMTDNLGSGGDFIANGSPASVAGPNVEDTRFQAIKTAIAVAANQSNSDGALDTNTILDGVLGDRLRVKYSTTGTFAGGTTIKIDAIAKG